MFHGEEGFEVVAVSSKVTAGDVVSDTDIQIQLDKAGINNWFDHIPMYCIYTSRKGVCLHCIRAKFRTKR